MADFAEDAEAYYTVKANQNLRGWEALGSDQNF